MQPTIKKVLTIIVVCVIIVSTIILPISAYDIENSNTEDGFNYYPIAWSTITFSNDNNENVNVALPMQYDNTLITNLADGVNNNTDITIKQPNLVPNTLDGNNKITQQYYLPQNDPSHYRTYLFGELDPIISNLSSVTFYAPFGVLDHWTLQDFITMYIRFFTGTVIESVTLELAVMDSYITTSDEMSDSVDVSTYLKHLSYDITWNATNNDNSNITMNLIPLRDVFNEYKTAGIDPITQVPYEVCPIYDISLTINTVSTEPREYMYFNYSAWATNYNIIDIYNTPITRVPVENITIIQPEGDFNWMNIIKENINSLLQIQIFPNFTFGWLLWIVIGLSTLFIFLKAFLGG